MSTNHNNDEEPMEEEPTPKRVPGAWKGMIWINDDDTFDDPLEDLERAIEESEIFPHTEK